MGRLLIEGKAGRLVEEISLLTLYVSGSKVPYMETLILKLDKDTIESRMMSAGNVCTVLYKSKEFKIKGKGIITLESIDLIKRLKLYPADDNISIEVDNNNVTIKGSKITSKFKQTDSQYCKWLKKDINVEDGMIVYGSTKKKPATKVILNGSELNQLPRFEKEVGVNLYNIHFEKGKSYGFVGDIADPSSKPIIQTIEAEIEGPEADISLAGGASEVFGSLNNEEWMIGTENEAPLWIIQRNKNHMIAFFVAPMASTSK